MREAYPFLEPEQATRIPFQRLDLDPGSPSLFLFAECLQWCLRDREKFEFPQNPSSYETHERYP